jgi:hypothetical protein
MEKSFSSRFFVTKKNIALIKRTIEKEKATAKGTITKLFEPIFKPRTTKKVTSPVACEKNITLSLLNAYIG